MSIPLRSSGDTAMPMPHTAPLDSPHEVRQLSAQLLAIQEYERQRIAVDLHDGLGQSLSLIRFSLEEASRLMASGTHGEAGDTLRRLIPRVKNAISEVRRISMNLRPSTLDDLGILATLSWFFREFEEACRGIIVEKHFYVAETDVPAPLKLTIYRLLQEAVNNIVKHAGANWIRVGLDKADDAIHLSIEDNGQGFDPVEAGQRSGFNKGLGLLTMKERAILSGGTYTLESAKGHGTRIRVYWPAERMALVG
ncbi:MAG: sensor histidine kinase [Sulfuricella sp.]|nr:sensor histidine kinase [Sulfuricella sp.]